MNDIGYLAAFTAGLVSFLSPCVLPLVPGYLSYISGFSIENMAGKQGGVTTGRVLLHSFLFGLGFALVFIAMGAAATTLGAFLQARMRTLTVVAGVIIILFGLQLLGVLRLRFLLADRRYQGRIRGGAVGTVLMGMAFAFGWTPCVGPILFAILAYAGTKETVLQGVGLLGAYAAGMGLPFLLIGFGVGRFLRFLDRFGRYLRWVEIAGGLMLVVMGVLMISGSMETIAGFIPAGCLPAG